VFQASSIDAPVYDPDQVALVWSEFADMVTNHLHDSWHVMTQPVPHATGKNIHFHC
jgi:hypothetical protein